MPCKWDIFIYFSYSLKKEHFEINKEHFENQLSSNAPIISSNIVALLPDNLACFYGTKFQKVIFYFRLRLLWNIYQGFRSLINGEYKL